MRAACVHMTPNMVGASGSSSITSQSAACAAVKHRINSKHFSLYLSSCAMTLPRLLGVLAQLHQQCLVKFARAHELLAQDVE